VCEGSKARRTYLEQERLALEVSSLSDAPAAFYKPEIIVATGPKPGLGHELVLWTVEVSCVVWIGSSRVVAPGKEHGSVPRTKSESRAAGVLCP
jgi:hypothetical protein